MFDRIEWLRGKGRTLERGDFRASDADREDAFRRIKAHGSMGHLNAVEASALQETVEASSSLNEIVRAFELAGLPELPARSPLTERRISTSDRDEAIGLLEKAYAEGRIEPRECAVAKDRVRGARTRSEMDAAFHGLPSPTRVAATETASKTSRQAAKVTTDAVAKGGRLAGRAFRRWMLSVGALMIGVILLISGIGVAALIFFVAAVLLFVSAAISLATP